MDLIGHTSVASDPGSPNPPAAFIDSDDECERLIQDFVDDISLDAEELELFVSMPDLTIADVRRLVAAARKPPCFVI